MCFWDICHLHPSPLGRNVAAAAALPGGEGRQGGVAWRALRSPPGTSPNREGAKEGGKGLKTGAIGYVSNLVIGVASTAPAYSLAVTLGFVTAVAGMGLHAPAVMIVSFIPMLLIAAAYNYMNKADPDCGTSFTWVTRALGPRLGWLTGWVIVAADVVVMATLAYIAGVYTFLLFGLNAASKTSSTSASSPRSGSW